MSAPRLSPLQYVLLVTLQDQSDPAKQSIHCNDSDHDAYPLILPSQSIAVCIQDLGARDAADQIASGITALTTRCTRIASSLEFLDHHALEDVGLVINVVECVLHPIMIASPIYVIGPK